MAGLMLFLAFGVGEIGCAATGGAAEPIQEAEKTGPPVAGEEKEGTLAEVQAEADQEEKEAEAQAEDRRKLAKLERDIEIARQKLVKAQVAGKHGQIQNQVAVAEAERELELEQRRLATFERRSAPNRIEWSRLGLLRAEDRLKEAEEELAQLELMYAEEDFADQTKEIVLERGRRRLERSRCDLELRTQDHAILTEETIPTELREHELNVEKKTEVLGKAQRDAEASALDNQIGIISAEAELARLEGEIEALREKIAKREEKDEAREKEQE
ncbi:MAG: hypothetical protein JSU68_14260 [Phycisphaerales bacterium]|nr:MAG: hypothetical protein JSU68_14260 [Phycisphaerales bacterium]